MVRESEGSAILIKKKSIEMLLLLMLYLVVELASPCIISYLVWCTVGFWTCECVYDEV